MIPVKMGIRILDTKDILEFAISCFIKGDYKMGGGGGTALNNDCSSVLSPALVHCGIPFFHT